eukprot:scaffold17628_cov116-Isochrysis_galbana.AAC.3
MLATADPAHVANHEIKLGDAEGGQHERLLRVVHTQRCARPDRPLVPARGCRVDPEDRGVRVDPGTELGTSKRARRPDDRARGVVAHEGQ